MAKYGLQRSDYLLGVRFVSLNACGGQKWPALADWFATQDFYILCLQEVIRAPVPSPEWLVYRDPYRQLDQRADLFGDVSRLLPRYQARFAAAARGTLVDQSGREMACEHGIAFWVHGIFPSSFYLAAKYRNKTLIDWRG